MKRLIIVMLVAMFAITGVAFAKKEATPTPTKATTQKVVQPKEMPKGITTASMEGQGKKVGFFAKWFGWGKTSEKSTQEATKAGEEKDKTKTEKQPKEKETEKKGQKD